MTTNRECVPAGRLHGPMVVSMRQIPEDRVDDAVRITRGKPDFGDPVDAEPGDVPGFWAWGVTPQTALMASRPPFAITHAPGYMFVSDKLDSEFRVA